jgi:hypothetical protein
LRDMEPPFDFAHLEHLIAWLKCHALRKSCPKATT